MPRHRPPAGSTEGSSPSRPTPSRRSPAVRLGAALAAAAVVASVAIAAVRVGDDGSPSTTTTTIAALPGTGEAGRWAVGPSDLPEGWGEAQIDMGGPSDPSTCGLDEGDPEVVVDRVAVAYDPLDDSGLNLGSTGLLAADADVAADLLARVEQGEVADCLDERLSSAFDDAGIEVRDLRVAGGAIPEGAHTTLSYALVVNDDVQPVTQEQVVMVDGERVAIVTFTSGADPFPTDLRAQVLGAVRGRLTQR